MAGSVHSPTQIAARQKALQPRFTNQNLVDATVSIGCRSFATLIKEGASAEELIEKVAKENGGGVAKVYYPQFDTWEIVAVEIGGELLVKGDPKRVAEADFSAFAEPGRTKSAAMEASRRSDGGIHFSLGAAGIPIAMTQDLGVVFPNAEELRVGSSTRSIALWMTSVSFDPVSLSDLDRTYKGTGGVSVSADALQKIASAHGGTRSDKLMLEDNLLVLNKDTGEIQTASQFSSQPMRELPAAQAFEFRTEPAPRTQNKIPIETFAVPSMWDGSPARQPQAEHVRASAARTFESSIMELLTVRFNPLRESLFRERIPLNASERFRAREAEAPAFALLGFAPVPERKAADIRQDSPRTADTPAKNLPERKEAAAKQPPSENKPNEKRILPETQPMAPPVPSIVEAWARLRTEKAELGMPSSVRTLKDATPDLARRAKTLKEEGKAVPRSAKAAKTKEHPARQRKRAEAKAAASKLSPAKTDKPRPKAETTAKKPEKPLKSAPAPGMKTGAPVHPSKSRKAKAEKAAHGTHGTPTHPARPNKAPIPARIARPSRVPHAGRRVKGERHIIIGKTLPLVRGRAGKKETVEIRKRPRKIDSRDLNQLIGLFRGKKRKRRLSGRTAAGS